MRRALVRFHGLARPGGNAAFAELLYLDAKARDFLVQGEHGFVLLADMALKPGQALLEAISALAWHVARPALRAFFPARA
jgi:hypothetical protein